MELFYVLALVVVLGLLAHKYMKEREQVPAAETVYADEHSYDQTKEELNSNNMENKENKETKGTKDLFLETLTKIGCQYELEDGEDGDIYFAYQGENFLVRTSNDVRYIQIFDTNWGQVELYDIDELTRLKKAINESNVRNSVTAVYTIDEAGGYVNLHCKSVILFIPEIPDLENYLRLELADYFRAHETINLQMEKQREMEAGK